VRYSRKFWRRFARIARLCGLVGAEEDAVGLGVACLQVRQVNPAPRPRGAPGRSVPLQEVQVRTQGQGQKKGARQQDPRVGQRGSGSAVWGDSHTMGGTGARAVPMENLFHSPSHPYTAQEETLVVRAQQGGSQASPPEPIS
jgi:hypothetical protein